MAKTRLLFIDNLRTLMIVLVILVHLSVTYGGEGSWFYTERPVDALTTTALTFFNAATQSYFMGFLFFLAGYFTPASYDRKGRGPFVRDRLLRLGIPMLAYDLAVTPLLVYILYRAGEVQFQVSVGERLKEFYTTFHLGTGPLWFVEALLIFSLIYAGYRLLRRGRPVPEQRELPGTMALLALAAFMGLASFLVRIWLPIGWAFAPLNLQFPFFPQYLCMFPLGIIAYRNDWLMRLPRAAGRRWLAVAAVLVFVVFPVMFVLGGALEGDVWKFLGECYWQAFAYAMWEQLLGVAMIVGLTVLFRESLNRSNSLTREAAAASYATYILHAPVVVLITLAARSIEVYPLLKCALVAVIVVPLSFALGAALRRLPAARRIL